MNLGFLAASNILFASVHWVIVLAIAQKLDLIAVGQYGFSLAVASPLIILLEMEHRAILASDILNKINPFGYLYTRLGIFLIVVTLAVPILSYFIIFKFESELYLVVFLCVIFKMVNSLSDITYGYLMRIRHQRVVSISIALRASSTLAGFLVGLYLYESLVWSIALSAALNLTVFLIFDLRIFFANCIANTERYRFNATDSIDLIRMSLPMSFVGVFSSLTSALPKYLLSIFSTTQSVGVFTVLYHFLSAGNTFTNSLNQYYMPIIASFFRLHSKLEFLRSVKFLLICNIIVGLTGILIALLLGDVLLVGLYGEELRGFRYDFIIVMLGALFAYLAVAFSNLAVVTRSFKRLPIVISIVAIVTVSISLLLLGQKISALTAVSIGFLSGKIVNCIGNFLIVKKYII